MGIEMNIKAINCIYNVSGTLFACAKRDMPSDYMGSGYGDHSDMSELEDALADAEGQAFVWWHNVEQAGRLADKLEAAGLGQWARAVSKIADMQKISS